MDTMLQFSILGQNTRELYLPTRLQRAIINTKRHKQIIEALSEGESELCLLHVFESLLQI
jgi:fatty acid synthase